MCNSVKGRGRPKADKQRGCSQDAILTAARQRFMVHPYQKVTTRSIAEAAGVDMALISYYFGGKEGLYKAVFDDLYRPFFQRLNVIERRSEEANTVEELFMTILELDLRYPELLGIIYKTLVLNEGPKKQFIHEQILTYTDKIHVRIFSMLQQRGFLRTDFDPELLKDSFNALVMTPFFFYPLTSKKQSQSETIAYIERLYRQNVRLFLQGCGSNSTSRSQGADSARGDCAK